MALWDGWRGRLSAAYTTDVLYSNVNYVTLEADFRHYLRLSRNISFASRALGRMNHGREARLWFMGGSWDLRGYPIFDVRGKKAWFTTHELRFSIVENPSAYIPPLAILGVVNLRGALFFDAAHTWNDRYHERIPQIFAGETLGSTGLGFRLNLFRAGWSFGMIWAFGCGMDCGHGKEISFANSFLGLISRNCILPVLLLCAGLSRAGSKYRVFTRKAGGASSAS